MKSSRDRGSKAEERKRAPDATPSETRKRGLDGIRPRRPPATTEGSLGDAEPDDDDPTEGDLRQ